MRITFPGAFNISFAYVFQKECNQLGSTWTHHAMYPTATSGLMTCCKIKFPVHNNHVKAIVKIIIVGKSVQT